MPEEDRYAYAEGLSRGGYLVSLYTTRENRDRILDILDDEGTVDMDAREESWRAEGWQGYQASEPTLGTERERDCHLSPRPASPPMRRATGRSKSSRRTCGSASGTVDQGRVRVRTYVVETPVEEDVSLRNETVHLERKAVDRAVRRRGDAFVDRTIEATETNEEAVVSKEARVTEEISLGKLSMRAPRPSATRCVIPRSRSMTTGTIVRNSAEQG